MRFTYLYFFALFLLFGTSCVKSPMPESIKKLTNSHDKPTSLIKSPSTMDELPHFFFSGNDTTLVWISNGIKHEVSSENNQNFSDTIARLAQRFELPLVEALEQVRSGFKGNAPTVVQGISRVAAISDIHGQYDIYKTLLQGFGIVDEALNWAYGNGHLVINGDIMNRGGGVTEALWLTFKLQQQAAKQGGQVHFIAGNHELMIFDNDVRYLNSKYLRFQEIIGRSYHQQYSSQSFFGQWMRTSPILIQVNDVGYLHAGISPAVLAEGLSPAQINARFQEDIFTQDRRVYRQNRQLDLLARTDGPLWYRGYFQAGLLTNEDLDEVLSWWGVSRIVVGHTSIPAIRTLFDGRVIGIDASIKNGNRGELLLYENGNWFRGLLNGNRIPIS